MLLRARERGDEEVQQLGDADAGQRGDAEDRVEVAAGDGGLEVGDQVRDGQLVAGQVPLHQGLVLALPDDPLDQLAAEPVGVRGVDVRFEQRDQPAHRAVRAAVEQVHREDALPELPLAEPDGVLDVGARPVELGDDDRPRHADGGALLPELHGGGVHPVDGGDDEQGGVRGTQPGAQLPHEVR